MCPLSAPPKRPPVGHGSKKMPGGLDSRLKIDRPGAMISSSRVGINVITSLAVTWPLVPSTTELGVAQPKIWSCSHRTSHLNPRTLKRLQCADRSTATVAPTGLSGSYKTALGERFRPLLWQFSGGIYCYRRPVPGRSWTVLGSDASWAYRKSCHAEATSTKLSGN